MRYIAFLILIIWAAGSPAMAQAPAEGQKYANRQLADPVQEAAAYDLMFELRCVQCQGQSIGDSDAPIAGAMRHEVRSQIEAGKSAEDIRAFFVARYGDYISFEPPARGAGLLLWVAPLIMLIVAILLSRRLFRRPTS